jgi:hypothetical protein
VALRTFACGLLGGIDPPDRLPNGRLLAGLGRGRPQLLQPRDRAGPVQAPERHPQPDAEQLGPQPRPHVGLGRRLQDLLVGALGILEPPGVGQQLGLLVQVGVQDE